MDMIKKLCFLPKCINIHARQNSIPTSLLPIKETFSATPCGVRDEELLAKLGKSPPVKQKISGQKLVQWRGG